MTQKIGGPCLDFKSILADVAIETIYRRVARLGTAEPLQDRYVRKTDLECSLDLAGELANAVAQRA